MSLLGRPSRNRLVKETRCTKRIPTPSPLPYLRMGRGPHLQRSWALRFPSLSVATTKLEGLWVWPGLYCVDGITVQAARGPLIWNIDLRGRERRVDADIDCSQVLHESRYRRPIALPSVGRCCGPAYSRIRVQCRSSSPLKGDLTHSQRAADYSAALLLPPRRPAGVVASMPP